jgi:predicted nucleic acid-binding protein
LSYVLVDTSAWIAFFHGEKDAVSRIDRLLGRGEAALSGPVYAELLSGARTRSAFEDLRSLLGSLEWLEEPPVAWDRVAETRFALARQGVQASLVDLLIAVTAVEAGTALLTRDKDFGRIARVLPLDVTVF